MVRLGGFSVQILSNGEYIDEDIRNYVALQHKSEYKLVLKNHGDTKCDAEVKMDGESIGMYRIEPLSSMMLERPSKEAKKFTFVKSDSDIAKSTGASEKAPTNGLIQVTFKPERQKKPQSYSYSSQSSSSSSSSFGGQSRGGDTLGTFGATKSRMKKKCSVSDFDDEDDEDECMHLESVVQEKKKYDAGVTVLGSASSQKFNDVPSIKDVDLSRIAVISLRLVLLKEEPIYTPFHTKIPPPVN